MSAASAQCAVRTNGSQTRVRRASPKLFLDLRLHDRERLCVEVDLDLLAFLVVAVDLVAVAVDLELADLVALRLELGLRLVRLQPLLLWILRAARAGECAGAGEGEGKKERLFHYWFSLCGEDQLAVLRNSQPVLPAVMHDHDFPARTEQGCARNLPGLRRGGLDRRQISTFRMGQHVANDKCSQV